MRLTARVVGSEVVGEIDGDIVGPEAVGEIDGEVVGPEVERMPSSERETGDRSGEARQRLSLRCGGGRDLHESAVPVTVNVFGWNRPVL